MLTEESVCSQSLLISVQSASQNSICAWKC